MNKDKNGDDASIEPYKINARDFVVPTQVMILCIHVYGQIHFKLLLRFFFLPTFIKKSEGMQPKYTVSKLLDSVPCIFYF